MLSWTANTSLCSITFGTETRCKMINVKERCLVKEDNGGVSRGWPLERLTRLWKHSLGLLTTLSVHTALLPLSDPPSESPHRLVAPRAIWRAGLFTTFSRLGFLHCSREVAMFARSQRGRVGGFERTRGRKALGKALRKARQSSRRGGESSVSRRRTSEGTPIPVAVGQPF